MYQRWSNSENCLKPVPRSCGGEARRGPLHLPRRGAPDDGSEPAGESPVQRLTGTRATGLYQMGRAWIGVEQHQFLRPDWFSSAVSTYDPRSIDSKITDIMMTNDYKEKVLCSNITNKFSTNLVKCKSYLVRSVALGSLFYYNWSLFYTYTFIKSVQKTELR